MLLPRSRGKQAIAARFLMAGHYLILSGGIAQMMKNSCHFITQFNDVIFIYMEIILLLIQIKSLLTHLSTFKDVMKRRFG